MNRLYRLMAETAAARALAAAQHAAEIEHRGLMGRAREIFVSQLLPPVLAPTMSVCTGVIVDSLDGQSKQTDVIVFDRRIAPPLQFSAGNNEAAIPCESVLFAVEVKSRLTSTDLKASIDWARSVKDRTFSSQVFRGVIANRIDSVPCALFAYDTDLAATSGLSGESRRLHEAVGDQPEDRRLRVPLSCLTVATRGTIECVGANQTPPRFEEHSTDKPVDAQSSASWPGSHATPHR